jgi:hypothetical protein
MYYEVEDVLYVAHDALDAIERKLDSGKYLRRFFIQFSRVKWYTPPIVVARTLEVDEPYRRCNSVLFRYWWNRGIVLGMWGNVGYDEAEQLLEATIMGRERTQDERDAVDDTIVRDHTDELGQGASGTLRVGGHSVRAGTA